MEQVCDTTTCVESDLPSYAPDLSDQDDSYLSVSNDSDEMPVTDRSNFTITDESNGEEWCIVSGKGGVQYLPSKFCSKEANLSSESVSECIDQVEETSHVHSEDFSEESSCSITYNKGGVEYPSVKSERLTALLTIKLSIVLLATLLLTNIVLFYWHFSEQKCASLSTSITLDHELKIDKDASYSSFNTLPPQSMEVALYTADIFTETGATIISRLDEATSFSEEKCASLSTSITPDRELKIDKDVSYLPPSFYSQSTEVALYTADIFTISSATISRSAADETTSSSQLDSISLSHQLLQQYEMYQKYDKLEKEYWISFSRQMKWIFRPQISIPGIDDIEAATCLSDDVPSYICAPRVQEQSVLVYNLTSLSNQPTPRSVTTHDISIFWLSANCLSTQTLSQWFASSAYDYFKSVVQDLPFTLIIMFPLFTLPLPKFNTSRMRPLLKLLLVALIFACQVYSNPKPMLAANMSENMKANMSKYRIHSQYSYDALYKAKEKVDSVEILRHDVSAGGYTWYCCWSEALLSFIGLLGFLLYGLTFTVLTLAIAWTKILKNYCSPMKYALADKYSKVQVTIHQIYQLIRPFYIKQISRFYVNLVTKLTSVSSNLCDNISSFRHRHDCFEYSNLTEQFDADSVNRHCDLIQPTESECTNRATMSCSVEQEPDPLVHVRGHESRDWESTFASSDSCDNVSGLNHGHDCFEPSDQTEQFENHSFNRHRDLIQNTEPKCTDQATTSCYMEQELDPLVQGQESRDWESTSTSSDSRDNVSGLNHGHDCFEHSDQTEQFENHSVNHHRDLIQKTVSCCMEREPDPLVHVRGHESRDWESTSASSDSRDNVSGLNHGHDCFEPSDQTEQFENHSVNHHRDLIQKTVSCCMEREPDPLVHVRGHESRDWESTSASSDSRDNVSGLNHGHDCFEPSDQTEQFENHSFNRHRDLIQNTEPKCTDQATTSCYMEQELDPLVQGQESRDLESKLSTITTREALTCYDRPSEAEISSDKAIMNVSTHSQSSGDYAFSIKLSNEMENSQTIATPNASFYSSMTYFGMFQAIFLSASSVPGKVLYASLAVYGSRYMITWKTVLDKFSAVKRPGTVTLKAKQVNNHNICTTEFLQIQFGHKHHARDGDTIIPLLNSKGQVDLPATTTFDSVVKYTDSAASQSHFQLENGRGVLCNLTSKCNQMNISFAPFLLAQPIQLLTSIEKCGSLSVIHVPDNSLLFGFPTELHNSLNLPRSTIIVTPPSQSRMSLSVNQSGSPVSSLPQHSMDQPDYCNRQHSVPQSIDQEFDSPQHVVDRLHFLCDEQHSFDHHRVSGSPKHLVEQQQLSCYPHNCVDHPRVSFDPHHSVNHHQGSSSNCPPHSVNEPRVLCGSQYFVNHVFSYPNHSKILPTDPDFGDPQHSIKQTVIACSQDLFKDRKEIQKMSALMIGGCDFQSSLMRCGGEHDSPSSDNELESSVSLDHGLDSLHESQHEDTPPECIQNDSFGVAVIHVDSVLAMNNQMGHEQITQTNDPVNTQETPPSTTLASTNNSACSSFYSSSIGLAEEDRETLTFTSHTAIFPSICSERALGKLVLPLLVLPSSLKPPLFNEQAESIVTEYRASDDDFINDNPSNIQLRTSQVPLPVSASRLSTDQDSNTSLPTYQSVGATSVSPLFYQDSATMSCSMEQEPDLLVQGHKCRDWESTSASLDSRDNVSGLNHIHDCFEHSDQTEQFENHSFNLDRDLIQKTEPKYTDQATMNCCMEQEPDPLLQGRESRDLESKLSTITTREALTCYDRPSEAEISSDKAIMNVSTHSQSSGDHAFSIKLSNEMENSQTIATPNANFYSSMTYFGTFQAILLSVSSVPGKVLYAPLAVYGSRYMITWKTVLDKFSAVKRPGTVTLKAKQVNNHNICTTEFLQIQFGHKHHARDGDTIIPLLNSKGQVDLPATTTFDSVVKYTDSAASQSHFQLENGRGVLCNLTSKCNQIYISFAPFLLTQPIQVLTSIEKRGSLSVIHVPDNTLQFGIPTELHNSLNLPKSTIIVTPPSQSRKSLSVDQSGSPVSHFLQHSMDQPDYCNHQHSVHQSIDQEFDSPQHVVDRLQFLCDEQHSFHHHRVSGSPKHLMEQQQLSCYPHNCVDHPRVSFDPHHSVNHHQGSSSNCPPHSVNEPRVLCGSQYFVNHVFSYPDHSKILPTESDFGDPQHSIKQTVIACSQDLFKDRKEIQKMSDLMIGGCDFQSSLMRCGGEHDSPSSDNELESSVSLDHGLDSLHESQHEDTPPECIQNDSFGVAVIHVDSVLAMNNQMGHEQITQTNDPVNTQETLPSTTLASTNNSARSSFYSSSIGLAEEDRETLTFTSHTAIFPSICSERALGKLVLPLLVLPSSLKPPLFNEQAESIVTEYRASDDDFINDNPSNIQLRTSQVPLPESASRLYTDQDSNTSLPTYQSVGATSVSPLFHQDSVSNFRGPPLSKSAPSNSKPPAHSQPRPSQSKAVDNEEERSKVTDQKRCEPLEPNLDVVQSKSSEREQISPMNNLANGWYRTPSDSGFITNSLSNQSESPNVTKTHLIPAISPHQCDSKMNRATKAVAEEKLKDDADDSNAVFGAQFNHPPSLLSGSLSTTWIMPTSITDNPQAILPFITHFNEADSQKLGDEEVHYIIIILLTITITTK